MSQLNITPHQVTHHINRGWYFTAQQVSKRRVCLVSASRQIHALYDELLHTLLILGIVKDVLFLSNENNSPGFLLQVEAAYKPCIVIQNHVFDDNLGFEIERLIELSARCIILFVTPYVTSVPEKYLQHIPLLLWDVSYFVHVPYVAQYHRFIEKCMFHKRQALLHNGPVLFDEVDNICCTLNLFDYDLAIGHIVVYMQRTFRWKVHCVIVLQRFIKKYLYRPNAALSQQIISRLYSCKK
jgi:hypothetical protein